MTRVLVVEDDADIRMLLRSVLSLTGFDVVDVDCGAAAIRVLEEHSASPPDLAILDLRMPGVDGWGVLDRIRAAPDTTDLPVIVCSVDATEEDIARGRDLGCDGYLQKPFEIDDLVGEVQAVAARLPRRSR